MCLSLSTYDTAISICACPCQPMILPIKFASHVFCILRKFRNFLKPVTVQENTLYTCRSFFDIYHNLMLRLVLFWNHVISQFYYYNIINIDNNQSTESTDGNDVL